MVDMECSTSIEQGSNIIEIGSRIECLSYYGTVKFVGEIAGYKSVWLGIDWDDYIRGKHDGSVNGHQYFETSTPTSGSFVRPGKVRTGIDAITAITSRYGNREDQNEALVNKKELLNLQREINAPFLTMVGFEKVNERQSNFKDLRVVSLRLQYVNGPGPYGQILSICPNIYELDISKNLLYKWDDIFNICKQLRNLRWLNISENLLTFPEDTDCIVFPTLRTLICGYMKLTWNDVLKISHIFPEMEEFRMPFNSITNIEVPNDHCFKSLKILDLEGNVLDEWSEINKLGVLPFLKHLIVTKTSIQIIELGPCDNNGKVSTFENLRQLVISENYIDNWESISELNKLNCLEDLRFLKNPIWDVEKSGTSFQLTIARIATLTVLNGTIIKPEDRKGAEYDYIKKYGLEWLLKKDDEEFRSRFMEKHPRYVELITRYGEPVAAELTSKAPSLKSSLTTVQIIYEDRIVTKKLPATMMLQKLVMLVQKVFSLDERPELYYISSERPEMEIALDDEFKEIGFYSLQDGDRIYVK